MLSFASQDGARLYGGAMRTICALQVLDARGKKSAIAVTEVWGFVFLGK